jgi:hypothetical protein
MAALITVKSYCLPFFEKNIVVKKRNYLYLGLVTPSSGRLSPMGLYRPPDGITNLKYK